MNWLRTFSKAKIRDLQAANFAVLFREISYSWRNACFPFYRRNDTIGRRETCSQVNQTSIRPRNQIKLISNRFCCNSPILGSGKTLSSTLPIGNTNLRTFVNRMTIAVVIAALMLIPAVSASANGLASSSASKATVSVCPFCSAVALTFAEQLDNSEIAVVAELVSVPPPVTDPDEDFPKAKFKIVQVLKGDKFVKDEMTFQTQLVGTYPKGSKFLVMGVDPPTVAWTTPMKASDRVFDYLNKIQDLPESGGERLIFFQNFFEDKESVLAFDAFDEFARAPYEDLIEMKDQMDREKLIGWIKDKDTLINRRRLYFTMLGVCGTDEDIPLLEELIKSDSRKKRAGLDALIACYLNLKGEDGVDLVEATFISDREADYVDTLAAVTALRFHGTEVDIISKKRIVKAVRQLLERPKYADMIIPDLARWEDWSSMETLVKMFKEADPESNWLRVPVITYLRACPKPEAKAYIEELGKIDPEAVERADFFLGFDDDEEEEEEVEKADPPAELIEQEEKKFDRLKSKPSLEDPTSNDPPNKSAELTKADQPYVVRKIPVDVIAQDSPAIAPVAAEITKDSGSNESDRGLEVQPNSQPANFVTTGSGSMSAQAPPVVAKTISAPAPPVAAAKTPDLTLSIIFIPMAISVLIFLLLWSVVNGWFERLIF